MNCPRASVTDQERLRAVLDHITTGVAFLDATGRILAVNRAFGELTGQGPALIGKSVFEFESVAGSSLADDYRQALQKGEPVHRREIPITPDAIRERRVLDLDLLPLKGPDGKVSELVLIALDVTRRLSEEARSRLFREAFLQSTNAMEVTDHRGVLVDVNPAFEKIYGWRRDEVVGRRPNVVASPRTPKALHDAMWRALLDPKVAHWSGELTNVSKDGVEHPVLLSITPVHESSGQITHYIGVAVDLSERRAWEQQAVHSERLASLGQLAAGVAHELNTPLANIMLVAESVQRKTKDAAVRDRMSTIVGQTETAARIVRGLLDFSRRHEPQIRELNLSDVVRDAIGFLKGKQSEDVEILEEYARGRILIRGDRDQLIQVVTNILNNGYEAMDGHGSIRVRVRSQNGVAEAVIQDSGPGIPPSVLPHIFEPFFTTKADRNGTGLGLAICHGIIQAHGGQIHVESDVGHGAKFTLEFPLVGSEPAPDRSTTEHHPPPA